MNKVKEYVLKNYPRLFQKKIVTRVKGKIVNSKVVDLPVIIEEFDSHWAIKSHKDASPLILSKKI